MKRNAVFELTVLLAVVLLAVSWGGASASTRYTIFGQVLDESGLGLAGVTLFIEGDTEVVVTTDENGVWTAEVRGTVTVTPEKVDFAFSPSAVHVYARDAAWRTHAGHYRENRRQSCDSGRGARSTNYRLGITLAEQRRRITSSSNR